MYTEKRRNTSQSELISEPKCLEKKSETRPESESVLLIESISRNNTVDATAAYDPFRSGRVCNEEIELKPLQFNVFDDFLHVINHPQSVLLKKQ